MELSDTSGNSRESMLLLGKCYNVIRCNTQSILSQQTNKVQDLVQHHENSDVTFPHVSVTPSEHEADDNISLEVDDSNVSPGTTNISTENDSINHSSEQLVGTPIEHVVGTPMPATDQAGVDDAELVQETNHDNANDHVLEENLQMQDVENIDDVVNLALSLDLDSSNQTFAYEVTTPVVTNIDSSEAPPEKELPEHKVTNENSLECSANDQEGTSLSGSLQEEAPVETPIIPSAGPPVQSNNVAISQEMLTNEENFPPDFDESDSSESFVSLSGKVNILEYAKSEWKGTTYTAECLREGYQKLSTQTGCKYMRQVRGDNYCALRATAFQILTENSKILSSYPDWQEHVFKVPERIMEKYNCTWLNEWTFAQRLSCSPQNKISLIHECLSFFVEQKQLTEAMGNNEDRQAHFSALFNSGSLAEIKLFEAVKLLMLESAISLYTANSNGGEVPVFAWLLFARDSSETPKQLMLNHLNHAGKSSGLEQVEMCLLGYALQVTVQVFRPSSASQEDFISYYPDHMLTVWDKVDLIAEDDRHYNIVVKA